MQTEKVWALLEDGSIRFVGLGTRSISREDGRQELTMTKLALDIKAGTHFKVTVFAETEQHAKLYLEQWLTAGSPNGQFEAKKT